jgi:integrase
LRWFTAFCPVIFPDEKLYLKKLQARHVVDFVLQDTSDRGRHSAELAATVLRSFLNFLFQKGRVAVNLAAVAPSIPRPHLAGVPRYLEAREVEMVLRSCDRRRKIGKRNYAIFLLLARLGLRADEVTRLTLDDVDWRAGELLVRGKGARVDRLPLLQEVGEALSDYLKNARPVCSSRRLFIQCRAPLEGFAGPGCVSNLVREALLRLNLSPANRGAHVLRHSLATGMLRNGASLAQIGQVLRHQLPQTTEIYAKVDFSSLRALALPWPGGVL